MDPRAKIKLHWIKEPPHGVRFFCFKYTNEYLKMLDVSKHSILNNVSIIVPLLLQSALNHQTDVIMSTQNSLHRLVKPFKYWLNARHIHIPRSVWLEETLPPHIEFGCSVQNISTSARVTPRHINEAILAMPTALDRRTFLAQTSPQKRC